VSRPNTTNRWRVRKHGALPYVHAVHAYARISLFFFQRSAVPLAVYKNNSVVIDMIIIRPRPGRFIALSATMALRAFIREIPPSPPPPPPAYYSTNKLWYKKKYIYPFKAAARCINRIIYLSTCRKLVILSVHIYVRYICICIYCTGRACKDWLFRRYLSRERR